MRRFNFDSVPAIVARFLADDPALAQPRNLAERNAFQGRIIRAICDAHDLRSVDAQALIGAKVGFAYAEHVPHR